MMCKTVHGMTSDYLTSKFVSRDEITSYRLRNTENKSVIPLPRTNYLKKSFPIAELSCGTAYPMI